MADKALAELRKELEQMKGVLTNALPDIFAGIAAQQRHIAELEAGLRDTESMLYQAHQLLGSSWSFMLQNDLIQPVDLAQMLIDAVERWNVQYAARNTADPLRADGEKGGGG